MIYIIIMIYIIMLWIGTCVGCLALVQCINKIRHYFFENPVERYLRLSSPIPTGGNEQKYSNFAEIFQEVQKIYPQWDTEFRQYVMNGEAPQEFLDLAIQDKTLDDLLDQATIIMVKGLC